MDKTIYFQERREGANSPTGPTVRLGLVLTLAAIFGLYSLLGCQSEQKVTQQRLKLAGSTTVEPVASVAAKAFMDKHPNTEITVRGGGSTIGVKGIMYGALHVGMTSRPVKKEELESSPNMVTTAIGRDGVAVVVNQSLYKSGVTKMTLEQIANIWLGKITNWKVLGGPDLAIKAFDKEMGRGTRDTFALIVLGKETAPAPGTVGALGENEDVLRAVAENAGAVSILSTGWQTKDVIGVAVVGKDGQAVEPTVENVASGKYPILRDLNLITDGAAQGLAAQFIEFMLSPEGQTFVEKHGYVAVSKRNASGQTPAQAGR